MKISAIALAGGQSSRMGHDKALIEIDSVPLLQRICEAARQAGATEIAIVTGWQERYQHLNLPSGTKFVHECDRQGALFGFALGLKNLSPTPLLQGEGLESSKEMEAGRARSLPDWVLLLACDLPNLDGVVLQTWASQLSALPEQAIAYLPRHIGSSSENSSPKSKQPEWEPLCGFYRSTCLKNLEEFISKGSRSFQDWLAQNQVEAIPEVDPRILFNCNTPTDLLRVRIAE
jgi:molybdenum cofactor guanylyltransferase